MRTLQRLGLIVLIAAGARLRSAGGVSLSILAPVAGQTLVSGSETLVQVSLDASSMTNDVQNCGHSKVELHRAERYLARHTFAHRHRAGIRSCAWLACTRRGPEAGHLGAGGRVVLRRRARRGARRHEPDVEVDQDMVTY